jgi:ABC-type spermidine/putrescine transport system permease subunit II
MKDKTTLPIYLAWLLLSLVLAFLYLPMLMPVMAAFGSLPADGHLLSNFLAVFEDQRLKQAMSNSFLIGLVVAIITPILSIFLAHAIRKLNIPRIILAFILLPLFVPGISMGVATALFFQVLGLSPSLLSIVLIQTIWALPFSTLVVLTVMSRFDVVYLEASYMLGYNKLSSFFRIELPMIAQGVIGAAIFSFILSFNETVRTAVVQGRHNTIQTYLWSQYQQVGLSPALYALMTMVILVTFSLIVLLAVMDSRKTA